MPPSSSFFFPVRRHPDYGLEKILDDLSLELLLAPVFWVLPLLITIIVGIRFLVSQRNIDSKMDEATQQEIDRLNAAVDAFSTEMKARLREQAIKGYRGWDDIDNYQRIVDMTFKHTAVYTGEEVDAANLAMILWFLRRKSD